MIVLVLLIFLALTVAMAYMIGADAEASKDRPCEECSVRRETIRAEMQLQQITHAAMAQMLNEARRAQRDQLP